MNYREFYEQETGIQVPKTFDVHHIDHNRKNNSIENLVAIPRKLHEEYHESLVYKNCDITEYCSKLIGSMDIFSAQRGTDRVCEGIMELAEKSYQITIWILTRDKIRGKLTGGPDYLNLYKRYLQEEE